MSRRALVTGNAGFCGRHFTAALRDRGYEVTGCDPVLPGPAAFADEGYALDCREFFAAYPERFDLIVHCAAVIGGRAGIDGNPLGMSVNLDLDAAMFRYAAKTRPGRVIYLSSAAVYPVAFQNSRRMVRLSETDASWAHPHLPDQVYGWCKLTGEMLAAKARDAGIPVTVVRPFSGYGHDQDITYPFGAFIDRAARRADPFHIWGDGAQVRDFVHIDDVVAAALALADAGIDVPVNIGRGYPVSMTALAELACAAAGYQPRFETLPALPSGVAYRVADITRLTRWYQPQIMIHDGVAQALAHRQAAAA